MFLRFVHFGEQVQKIVLSTDGSHMQVQRKPINVYVLHYYHIYFQAGFLFIFYLGNIFKISENPVVILEFAQERI